MLSFRNFSILNPEAGDLARELLDNTARGQSDFMSFVKIWMAFNGWMESVTDAATDATMITAIAKSTRAIDTYGKLTSESVEFRESIRIYSEMWPVVSVRDVNRRLGRDAFSRFPREELLDQCRRHNVKIQPLTWNGTSTPTWEQVLRTIYLVRCNMFHGQKSPQNFRGHQLVKQSNKVLRQFVFESDCFRWQ